MAGYRRATFVVDMRGHSCSIILGIWAERIALQSAARIDKNGGRESYRACSSEAHSSAHWARNGRQSQITARRAVLLGDPGLSRYAVYLCM